MALVFIATEVYGKTGLTVSAVLAGGLAFRIISASPPTEVHSSAEKPFW